MTHTRRNFLKTTAAAGLAFNAIPIIGADAIVRQQRTALVGCGWWGNNILGEAMASGECKITALCDVDQRLLDTTAERVTKESGAIPRKYKDFREMLKEEYPDVVIVATPDHWHPLITIEAVKHGAHVYVEKPISHTINEGRAMVNAARKYLRVVQVGTHRRVSPHCISARNFIRDGKLGKLHETFRTV